jgi:hypothetical protein
MDLIENLEPITEPTPPDCLKCHYIYHIGERNLPISEFNISRSKKRCKNCEKIATKVNKLNKNDTSCASTPRSICPSTPRIGPELPKYNNCTQFNINISSDYLSENKRLREENEKLRNIILSITRELNSIKL